MRSAISLMVVTLALSACASDPTPSSDGPAQSDENVVLTAGDAGLDLEVTMGDTVQVVLEGNPSTGYGWEVDSIDDTVLQLIDEPVFDSAAEGDLVGASGTFTFAFEAVGEGETALGLIYRRPWDDAEPADTFEVTVTVVT